MSKVGNTPVEDGQPNPAMRWLQRHGFAANPFVEREAGREKRLGEYFVPGPYFDEIKGSTEDTRPCFVFARRGCGKSAYRAMVQASCRPIDRESTILAVTYMDCRLVLAKAGGKPDQVTLDHHLQVILAKALETCVHEWIEDPSGFLNLSPERKGNLKWLVTTYALALLRPTYLADRLRDWGHLELGNLLENATEQGPIGSILARVSDNSGAALKFLATFYATPSAPLDETLPPLEHFRELTALIRRANLPALYVLVEGVDEVAEMANRPESVVAFLKPLASEVLLMELPGVSFKFFLPLDVLVKMEENRAARFDRFPPLQINWDTENLILILRQRLQAYSRNRISSLGQVTEEPLSQTIDQELVTRAYGSPRNLLVVGDLLLQNHCGRTTEELFITQADLDNTLKSYKPESVPLLWIDEEKRRVYIGEQELPVKFTALEYDLLAFLYRSSGALKSKDDIYREVWEPSYRKNSSKERKLKGHKENKPEEPEVASDEAMESLISRLRKKIEVDPKRPMYLVTERGRGYCIKNTT